MIRSVEPMEYADECEASELWRPWSRFAKEEWKKSSDEGGIDAGVRINVGWPWDD